MILKVLVTILINMDLICVNPLPSDRTVNIYINQYIITVGSPADIALRNGAIVSLYPLPTLETRHDAWSGLPLT